MSSIEAFRRAHDYACWCGQREARLFCRQMFGRRPFLVLRCAGCQTHRILPRALPDEASAGRLYNEYQPEVCNGEPERIKESFLRRSRRVGMTFAPGQHVLDVGCGHGVVLNAICDQFGCAGHGIDVDRRRIATAQARAHRAEFACGLFDSSRLDRSYDIVLFNAVLEHVVDPVHFLRQLREAMAPDGSLFVLTPNAASLNYRILRSWWRELLSIGEHIYLFTPDSLRACALRAGLRVVDLSSDFDFTGPRFRLWPPRQALIGGWWLYREGVKRLSSLVCSDQTGDILYARLRRD